MKTISGYRAKKVINIDDDEDFSKEDGKVSAMNKAKMDAEEGKETLTLPGADPAPATNSNRPIVIPSRNTNPTRQTPAVVSPAVPNTNGNAPQTAPAPGTGTQDPSDPFSLPLAPAPGTGGNP